MMEREATPEIFEQGYWSNRMPAQRPDGSTWLCHNTCYFFQTPDSEEAQWVAFYRDVTEQVRSEQQQRELQEQIIAAQDAALRELSTPLIPITDGVVAMPLIGSIDSKRAQLVIETLLSGVAKTRANTAIIDITGVSVVDTQVANALLRAAQSIKLLGANAILTGIRPEVAQTLIGLGVDLSGISTCATLQSGIAEALNRGSDTNRSGRGIPGSRSVSYP
jgi:anti-anti-sigma regulatory factor